MTNPISFRNIQSLSLADVNFGQSGLGKVLKVLSSKVKTLQLDHVYGWDTDDLRITGESCQALGKIEIINLINQSSMFSENLTLSNCTIDATILHNSESDKKVRYFPNLTKLIISSNITHSQVNK